MYFNVLNKYEIRSYVWKLLKRVVKNMKYAKNKNKQLIVINKIGQKGYLTFFFLNILLY